jgi:predicted dehydrogenase/threonine dehydrogenase-like Zn-dependent dehydrogenase
MKQVLQQARTGDVEVVEVPVPRLLPGCVLVRIAASVVSAGTERASTEFASKSLWRKAQARPDLVREVIGKVQRDGIVSAWQAVRTRLDQPQAPGYSSSGTVLAVGEGITDLQPGDRVACAGAGFAVHAEVACVPRLLVARIPLAAVPSAEVSFDEAAFTTLGAVALHGIRNAEANLGDLVAVIGLGLLGQLIVQLLKAAGCRVLGMDFNTERAELCKSLGADAIALSPSALHDLCLEYSHGAGADSVLIAAETASSDPVNLAAQIARDRGIVVAVGTVGIDIERKAYYEKEIDFRISRSYGPGRYDSFYEQKGHDYPIGYVRWTETRNMEAFLQLLSAQKIDVSSLITHRFPVVRANEAYELISGKLREPYLGVVIEYPGNVDGSLTLVPDSLSRDFSARAPSGDVRSQIPSSDRVTVGLLGAGAFATGTLIPALKASRNTILAGVCTATGAHAHHAASKFGFGYCTTDPAQLLQDPGVNTIVIATRHQLHANQVVAVLEAGKHVFCEKPLCLSEDELCKIVRTYCAIPARKPAFMVGFNRRFAPMTASLKSFFAEIPEPLFIHYRINAGGLPADHWVNDPEQGGRVLGEVCHFVDLLSHLVGSPIISVEAQPAGSPARYGESAIAHLRFANDSQGTISYLTNGDRAFCKERLEVFGGGAVAALEDFRRLELSRHGRRQTFRSRWRQNKGHQAEWAAFVESIRTGKAAIALDELICSSLATLRIKESLATGKRIAVDAPVFLESALQGARHSQ